MIDVAETQSENERAPGRQAAWYLRSLADHDTHRGELRKGVVVAQCGARFEPLRWVSPGPGLPGKPPDPDQVCSECQRAGGAR
ncbi:MAG: hypothetical protein ACRDSZ_08390 [Pseudonocardiaceae bacterium]